MKRREEKIKRRDDQERYDVLCVWLCGFVFLFFCSKLPDPRIISNFHNYHYQFESIFNFSGIFVCENAN